MVASSGSERDVYAPTMSSAASWSSVSCSTFVAPERQLIEISTDTTVPVGEYRVSSFSDELRSIAQCHEQVLVKAANVKSWRQLEDKSDLALVKLGLTILPNRFGQLLALQELDLRGNRLTELPDSFGDLVNLRTLTLRDNPLKVLPLSFGKLMSLKTLYLQGNEMVSLPETFGELLSLQSLYFRGSLLRALPSSFGQLQDLQTLYLRGTQVRSLPESFGMLSSLQTLYIMGNQLAWLPDSFVDLTALQTALLDSNRLIALPDGFGQLSSLQSLSLRANQLRSLPESFGYLPVLDKLCLQGNKLMALPQSFPELRTLQTLYLHGNPLEALPDGFDQMSQLPTLTLPDHFVHGAIHSPTKASHGKNRARRHQSLPEPTQEVIPDRGLSKRSASHESRHDVSSDASTAREKPEQAIISHKKQEGAFDKQVVTPASSACKSFGADSGLQQAWTPSAWKPSEAREVKLQQRSKSREAGAEHLRSSSRSRSCSKESVKSACSGCMSIDWGSDHEVCAREVSFLKEAEDFCPADEVVLRSMWLRVSPASWIERGAPAGIV